VGEEQNRRDIFCHLTSQNRTRIVTSGEAVW
jgi:hypothetical protein